MLVSGIRVSSIRYPGIRVQNNIRVSEAEYRVFDEVIVGAWAGRDRFFARSPFEAEP